MNRLDAHVDGAFLTEDEAHEAFPDLHERYAERFALDPEVGRRSFAAMHEHRRLAKEAKRR